MRTLGVDIGGTAVKTAIVVDGQTVATGTSKPYTQPSIDALRAAIADAVSQVAADGAKIESIGMCVPGIVNPQSGLITNAVNLHCVVGLEPASIVTEAVANTNARVWRFTDGHAAAFDVWRKDDGRIAAISIGTGVGLCVLDDGVPLDLGHGTPGHLGQIDVSLGEADAPIGPDGGRGGLEAYIGWPALQSRFGNNADDLEVAFSSDDAPLRALARALRIVHAIYRPQRIVLLGGVGTAIHPCLDQLHALVADQLTSLAREGWTLEAGTSLHHAASGAAKLAAQRSASVT